MKNKGRLEKIYFLSRPWLGGANHIHFSDYNIQNILDNLQHLKAWFAVNIRIFNRRTLGFADLPYVILLQQKPLIKQSVFPE